VDGPGRCSGGGEGPDGDAAALQAGGSNSVAGSSAMLQMGGGGGDGTDGDVAALQTGRGEHWKAAGEEAACSPTATGMTAPSQAGGMTRKSAGYPGMCVMMTVMRSEVRGPRPF
jgi:hypothetical protein